MRILLTTDTIGGMWTFTCELTTQLLAMGHAVALVSMGRSPSRAQQQWCASMRSRYPRRFWFEAFAVALEWMSDNEFAFAGALPGLLRIIKEFSPDLIHSSQFCFGALPVSAPVLITAHSDVLSWAQACRPGGLEPSAWLDCYVGLVQAGLDGAAAVVAPTHWMLEALLRHFSFACSAHVILNGRSLPEPASVPRLRQAVSVGRMWDEAKNLELLMRLKTCMPILVAGDEQFEMASVGAVMGEVQLLGALSEREILGLFSRSSAYIAASRYEPFGLAPLEAAQCGCAVLAHDIPSLREVWGEAALYFADGVDLDDLLHHLDCEPEELSEAQVRARARARQLTGARTAVSYVALYEELLSVAGCARVGSASYAQL